MAKQESRITPEERERMHTRPSAEKIITEAFPTSTLAATLPVASPVTLWDDLTSGAVEVTGFDLIKEKDRLIGVPFAVTAVVYRDGTPRKAAQGNKLVDVPADYVSLECRIAPAHVLTKAAARRAEIRQQLQFIDPLETVVINDGSTGICRQITAYLVSQGAITVPDGPEGGASGESRYDVYRADWTGSKVPTRDADGVALEAVRFDLGQSGPAPVLVCSRGLRKSDYDAAGGEATTFYLG